jgi:ATP/maltotriose-dependent transcriptional regulator MalT
VPGLWLVARAACAAGEIDRANDATTVLATLAEALATDLMKAYVAAARGLLAAARGEHETARQELERAVSLFASSRAPYETGWARLELARLHRTLGDRDGAELEARAALALYTRLGAAAWIERARREIGRDDEQTARSSPPSPSPATATPEDVAALGLSDRELEVLRLVALGLSNAEIAKRLFLSAHTVKRHVANILGKLELPTRAAAAAFAVKSRLT